MTVILGENENRGCDHSSDIYVRLVLGVNAYNRLADLNSSIFLM